MLATGTELTSAVVADVAETLAPAARFGYKYTFIKNFKK